MQQKKVVGIMQQKMLSELWDVRRAHATKKFVGILRCRLPGPQPRHPMAKKTVEEWVSEWYWGFTLTVIIGGGKSPIKWAKKPPTTRKSTAKLSHIAKVQGRLEPVLARGERQSLKHSVLSAWPQVAPTDGVHWNLQVWAKVGPGAHWNLELGANWPMIISCQAEPCIYGIADIIHTPTLVFDRDQQSHPWAHCFWLRSTVTHTHTSRPTLCFWPRSTHTLVTLVFPLFAETIFGSIA